MRWYCEELVFGSLEKKMIAFLTIYWDEGYGDKTNCRLEICQHFEKFIVPDKVVKKPMSLVQL